jgi:PAS domain-containing protein
VTDAVRDMSGDPLAVTSAERRRIFEDAQRQADAVFAQYQLSQLVALGGDLPVMARSVIGELVRVTDAVAGALWLATPPQRHLHVVATEPDALTYPEAVVVPERFATLSDAEAWVRPSGWHGVVLDERREIGDDEPGARIIGFIALRPPEGEALPPDRVRLLALVRHELAIAFRAAQLRQTLAGEQALLAAIFDGANDGIVAVDDQRRVVRVNRAAWSLLGGRRSVGAETCRDLLGCGEPLERGPSYTAHAHHQAPVGAADAQPLRCGQRCRFEEVLEGPSGIVDAEMRLVRVDGSDIPVVLGDDGTRDRRRRRAPRPARRARSGRAPGKLPGGGVA